MPEDILDGCFPGAALWLCFHQPSRQCATAWHLVEMAEARGIPISLDTGLDPVVRQPENSAPGLDYLKICITGEEEAKILTGYDDLKDQAAALLEHGIQLVAIKLGRRGAYLAWPQGELLLPAFKVEVKDTTGAGDAFSSAACSTAGCVATARVPAVRWPTPWAGCATTYYGAAWIGREEVLPFLQIRSASQQPDHPAHCEIQEVVHRLGMEA